MKKLITLFIMIFILQSPAHAEVVCRSCFVGDCNCEITDCDSGILDIFSSTSCTMNPDYEFTFSNSYLEWQPEIARSYYAKALCSDGKTQSDCSLITVKMVEKTTTTTIKEETTTTLPVSEEVAPDYILIALIIILILVILLVVYYLFLKKKGKRKTYEELYRKWGRK